MTKTSKPKAAARRQHPFECVALLLQGGGALGAYQAGVYQALAEETLEPDWVAGISIGAVNAAIIAGNAPGERISKLKAFWDLVTTDTYGYLPAQMASLGTGHATEHQLANWLSALRTIFLGIPGFFQPQTLAPKLWPITPEASISFCDTKSFRATLESLIDFDRINQGPMRFNVAAVNVTSGNFVNFDNKAYKIAPEHIMASAAIPPGFPPVLIDGAYYWDGGLVSNTPLQWVVESQDFMDTLVFQVDLWSADGAFPQNMADVLTRQKDIQFSSRTRANTDRFKEEQILHHTISSLLAKLPENMRDFPEVKLLTRHAHNKVCNIVHLIYHNKSYEGYAKDFEFSRQSMLAHWQAGYDDTLHSLQHPQVLQRPDNPEGIMVYDFSKHRRAAA